VLHPAFTERTVMPLLGAFAALWSVGAGVVRDLLASAVGP
jgi:hypothetical protein